MTFLTFMWIVLAMDLTLCGNANELWWKSKRTSSQSEIEDLRSAKNYLAKRSALEREVQHRERRQYFQRPVSDQGLPLHTHLSDHGIFNQDTSLCDEILSRSCWSPSDCEGCLGLFTCNLSKGTCYFKGVSSNTGNFHQSLQGEQEYDVASR